MSRERLLDALDAGASDPLTLVTGPPGAGKTLLLSAWLAERQPEGTVAWLSLERSESGPGRFWSALLEAVQAAGENGLAPLAEQTYRYRNGFLPAFANAVDSLPARLLVVLDDFHEIRAPEVAAQLDELLRHPPANLRVVLASRVDPALSLQRLRLAGRMTELRSSDLAFQVDEAAALFAAAGLELTRAQVERLQARTEGWVAGLRLAALSLQGGVDPEEFVSRFAGDEGAVGDYLVAEVLQRQPEGMREFMLRTGVVDLVSPELADALGARGEGAMLLERLACSNAFLTPVDDRRAWYRYHPLFAELLRSELRHRMPDAFRIQNRRAACWLASRQRHLEAMSHALAAQDWGTAASLLSRNWFTLVVSGNAPQAAEVIEQLPRDLTIRNPELTIAAAGALLDLGHVDEADVYACLAEERAGAVPAQRRVDFNLTTAIVALVAARLRGDFDLALTAAHKVLSGHGGAELSTSDRDRRALALTNLGIAELWTGDRRNAKAHLEDALALARSNGRSYLALGALAQLALLEATQGSLRDAASLAAEAEKLAERGGWSDLPQVAPAALALAVCAYHWGSMNEATGHLMHASAAARHSQDRTLHALIELNRAIVAAAAGDRQAAGRTLRAAHQDADGWRLPDPLEVALRSVNAGLLAADGNPEAATEVLDAARAHGGRTVELDLVRVRLALANGDPGEALRLARPGLDGTDETVHPASGIALHALGAVAHHLEGDDAGALDLTEQALALAQPEGYVRPFVAVGAPVRELLVRRIRAGTAHRSLAGEIVEALDPDGGRGSAHRAPLVLDPLSEREEAVLRYLPTVLSKAEIASELFVSVNTVKTHMKNIYRKLDVTSRADAVRRGRSLRLV